MMARWTANASCKLADVPSGITNAAQHNRMNIQPSGGLTILVFASL